MLALHKEGAYWKLANLRILSKCKPPCPAATPVHNNLGELWSQMSFLMPSVFSGSDDFQNTFSTAPEADDNDDGNGNEAELLVTNRLHQVPSLALCLRTLQFVSDKPILYRQLHKSSSSECSERALVAKTCSSALSFEGHLHQESAYPENPMTVQILRPFMLRRLKQDVASELSDKAMLCHNGH